MTRYLFLFVVLLYSGQVQCMSEEMQELINQLHNTCTAETGASDAVIEDARKGNFADDEKFKCYTKCLYDEMGCMTDDGKIDIEAAVAMIPPEVADTIVPIIKKCGNPPGANPCETVWMAHKCYQSNNPELYFLP